MALDRKVFAPGEVSLVSLLVCQQGVQVVRQLLRAPAEGVDHGAGWEESGEGGTGEQDRHSVQLQRIEGFLCDVVGADVVLEGEIEFVLPGHKVKAGVSLHCVRVPQPPILAASLGATASIDVHLKVKEINLELLRRTYPDSFGKPAYIPIPPAVGAAMGDEPCKLNLKLCKDQVTLKCSY